ncbi:hypothetical protein BKA63DRAFT_518477 [Paraphoma chrysanthemicola]|nr:hypothetical protein BKA63DRAFT_518477 [Paraphoma chrysanthemicola]
MSDGISESAGTGTQQSQKPLFSRTDVLRSTNETLYGQVADLAIQLAILGYTETASALIGRLNKHNWYHGRHAIIAPLHVLWDQIDAWPDGEMDRVKEDIQYERKEAAEKKVVNEKGEETGKKIKLDVDERPISKEDIKKSVDDQYDSYSKCWWYPERPRLWTSGRVEVPPSPHDRSLDLSVEELKKRIADLISATKGELNGKEPTDDAAALVSALELRIKLKEKDASTEDVVSENDILGMIAKKLNGRNQISELIQSRRAWPLLRDGVLLNILNIDKTKLDQFSEQLLDAVTERFDNGKQVSDNISIKDLVETINTNTRTNPESVTYFHEGDREVPDTILRDPAPASLIEETEKRLGTTLPADYKEYLSVTNGNDPAFGGIIMESPIWKCEDIRWIADDEDYFSDLGVDIPAEMASIMHQIHNDGLAWPKIGKSLIIGQEDIDNIFLIAPESVERVKEEVRSIMESKDEKVTQEVKDSVTRMVEDFAGSMEEFNKMEWCCVTWASGGAAEMTGFKNFKAYLSHVAESSKRVEKDLWNVEYDEFFGYLLVKGDKETAD